MSWLKVAERQHTNNDCIESNECVLFKQIHMYQNNMNQTNTDIYLTFKWSNVNILKVPCVVIAACSFLCLQFFTPASLQKN